MPKEIILPALSADFEGGILEEWHKDVGDKIEVGDVIADVSTDKAVVEIEAEHAGTLGKILVPAGTENVAVNTPIALLLLDGEMPEALDEFVAGGSATRTVTAPAGERRKTVTDDLAAPAFVETDSDKGDRLFATPVAVRIANQLGIDLSTVEGSGPGGRIVLGDVEAAAAQLPMQPVNAPSPRRAPIELPPAGTYTEVPLDNVRRVIARRLGEAKRDIPHFYLTVDCSIDKLLEARRHLNESTMDGVKLSVNDFMIKACAMALRDVPGVNTGWADSAILQFKDVNVAVAVSTPKGLMTPVVSQADAKGLARISAEIKELAERARAGRLKPDEYKGGSFTLSNLGMYGVREFSAIINPPQSCILAVGAGEQRAVVRAGEVRVATVISCTLSADHRAVDGALGAEFLQSLTSFIEEPERLLS